VANDAIRQSELERIQAETLEHLHRELEDEKLKAQALIEQVQTSKHAHQDDVNELQAQLNELKEEWRESDIGWERRLRRESENAKEEIRWLQTQLAGATT
jgi:peptidoglycan hydrolase CwlO-like protein